MMDESKHMELIWKCWDKNQSKNSWTHCHKIIISFIIRKRLEMPDNGSKNTNIINSLKDKGCHAS